MNVELHSISDDRKKINKTLNRIADINANLKAPCSIMRPVLEFDKASVGTEWYRANYAYIPSFGRYYHIDSITAESDGLMSLELSVDVLFTYRKQLMITQFQVVRAQRFYDQYFIDTQIPLKVDKSIRQTDQDFLGSIPQDTGSNKNNYVLTVAGG
jgi:hypothetical protein